MKKLVISIVLVGTIIPALAARELPYLESVKKFAQSPDALASKTASCQRVVMASPDNIECWAAHTARDLLALPGDTQKFVLDSHHREAALSKCKGAFNESTV
jgi:hypothetical protein